MTSLFRRNSNGGSKNGGPDGGGSGNSTSGQLNNSRPNRQIRRLEFNQAMVDFKTMFPTMEYEVIECVLRSNNGAILERTLEPDSSDEEPPPVYSPPTYDMHIYDRKFPETPPARSYRHWNPPLLGNLPEDFLRILPQQLNHIKAHSLPSESQQTSQASARPATGGTSSGSSSVAGATEPEGKLKQYLEDERIALFLQNEEFMRELQRNHDFLIALEREERNTSNSVESASDDAMFRDKLKHMGKSTRKKLFEIARTFSEKTKRRKSKRRTLLKHHSLGTANSTANLLDAVEGNPCEEDGQPRKVDIPEENEQHKS
ncbi:hypothetical protein CRUP_004123 [Coryphaenoides rupestris]|nr:hypothetical protein CRUP_004123 [Coryphaenoides rupestris]